MFERFTKEARQIVVQTQEVARRLRAPSIDTRHLVVALAEHSGPAARALAAVGLDPADVAAAARQAAQQADPLDADALQAVGIDLEAVRERTDAVFGEGALDRAGRRRFGRSPSHIPFTSDAKKALELSLREAIRLKQKTITDAHLLLGILRDEQSPGARAIRGLLAEPTTVSDLRHRLEQEPAA